MQVTVEKAECPQCGKHIMHLKAHMKRNHPVEKPKEAAPVEKPIEKPIVAPPVAPPSPEPELPEPVALPPTPPPSLKPKPSFAAVVTTVASNSSCSSAFTAILPYNAPKRLSPLTLPSMAVKRTLDYDRLMKNVFRHKNVCRSHGRKSEWALLCHLWQSAPEKFQVSDQHSTPSNPHPRVTVTIYRDHAHVIYSQYHIYMDPSAFAQALYVEGHDSGESYRVVEFIGKEATA